MKIRVRIAPSPTGPLHVGTARTALFNFIFARKHQGKFVLRIEDTDLERSDKIFEIDIIENLKWLGIEWDEGPDVGGTYAPYRQSERTKTYTNRIRQLMQAGFAYYCFCSEETLAREREDQQKNRQPLRYRGTCRDISRDVSEARVAKGESAIIRFRTPEKDIIYTDLVRGDVVFDMRLMGDIAIAKNEKTPLYNFAAVVDDADMNITHVLRGEDHIANTPKQIALAEALNFEPPAFGHFPLVLGSDRAKLSKRHGTATTVRELREAGYFPQAVVNFLCLLGWNPGTEQEEFSLEELGRVFDLSRVQRGGAIWDQKKLDRFNRMYAEKELKKENPSPPVSAVERIEKILEEQDWGIPLTFSVSGATTSIFSRVAPSEVENELKRNPYYFVPMKTITMDQMRWKEMNDEDIRLSLQKSYDFLKEISNESWNYPYLKGVLEVEAEKWGNGDRGKLLYPLRVALSGAPRSDSPFELAAWYGKEETLRRIQAAISHIP